MVNPQPERDVFGPAGPRRERLGRASGSNYWKLLAQGERSVTALTLTGTTVANTSQHVQNSSKRASSGRTGSVRVLPGGPATK